MADFKSREPARASDYRSVLRILDEEQNQLHALICAVMMLISPKNPDEPEDGIDILAWRLGQILEDRLAKTTVHNFVREILMGGSHE